MENNSKTWQLVLGLVIVVALAIWLVKMPKPETVVPTGNTEEEVISEEEIEAGGEMCYIWNTEAGDSATLKLNIDGVKANGTLNWIPAEKDRKTGTFDGAVTSVGVVDAFWKVSAEGMTYSEQLILKYNETTANVGFGMMVDRGDGTYVYSDPTKLSYEPNLSRTDCSDEVVN